MIVVEYALTMAAGPQDTEEAAIKVLEKELKAFGLASWKADTASHTFSSNATFAYKQGAAPRRSPFFHSSLCLLAASARSVRRRQRVGSLLIVLEFSH